MFDTDSTVVYIKEKNWGEKSGVYILTAVNAGAFYEGSKDTCSAMFDKIIAAEKRGDRWFEM